MLILAGPNVVQSHHEAWKLLASGTVADSSLHTALLWNAAQCCAYAADLRLLARMCNYIASCQREIHDICGSNVGLSKNRRECATRALTSANTVLHAGNAIMGEGGKALHKK